MSDRKTVYVIGAGAGFDIGVPTGDLLKKRISKLLDIEKYFIKGSQISNESYEIIRAFSLHAKK